LKNNYNFLLIFLLLIFGCEKECKKYHYEDRFVKEEISIFMLYIDSTTWMPIPITTPAHYEKIKICEN
jgi:hypothetical protein